MGSSAFDTAHWIALSIMFAAAGLAWVVRSHAARCLLISQLRELAEDVALDVARGRTTATSQQVIRLRAVIHGLNGRPVRALGWWRRDPSTPAIIVLPNNSEGGSSRDWPLAEDPLTDHWTRLADVVARYSSRALSGPASRRLQRQFDLVRPRSSRLWFPAVPNTAEDTFWEQAPLCVDLSDAPTRGLHVLAVDRSQSQRGRTRPGSTSHPMGRHVGPQVRAGRGHVGHLGVG